MADIYGRTFAYVTKNEAKEAKHEIEKIILELQNSMKKSHKFTFSFILIGSGANNLITKVVNGNKGFDFDYNLVLQNIPEGYDAKTIRPAFINPLNELANQYGFEQVQDKKRAITIRKLKDRKIVFSCDFAILNEFYYGNEDKSYLEIIVRDKQSGGFIWNRLPDNNYDLDEKISDLKANNLWGNVRDEYLELKNNNNDEDKLSSDLYVEAVNNVHNHYEWIR